MLAEVITHVHVVAFDLSVIVLVAFWLMGKFIAWGVNEEFRRGVRK